MSCFVVTFVGSGDLVGSASVGLGDGVSVIEAMTSDVGEGEMMPVIAGVVVTGCCAIDTGLDAVEVVCGVLLLTFSSKTLVLEYSPTFPALSVALAFTIK